MAVVCCFCVMTTDLMCFVFHLCAVVYTAKVQACTCKNNEHKHKRELQKFQASDFDIQT
jgi:hypothetical protein